MRFVCLVTEKLLKNCYKVAEKITVCALFTTQSQQSQLKKKKVENIDVNAGKRKTRFPNAYFMKNDKIINFIDSFLYFL